MQKVWSRLLGYSVSIAGISLAFVLLVLAFPELWFRPTWVSFFIPKVANRLGYSFQSSSLGAHAYRVSWNTIRFNLSWARAFLSKIDAEKTTQSTVARVEDLNASVTVTWFSLPPKIVEVNDLTLNLAEVDLDSLIVPTVPNTKDANSTQDYSIPDLSPLHWVPTVLKTLKIGRVAVSAPHLNTHKLLSLGSAFAFTLQRDPNAGPLQLSVRREGEMESILMTSIPVEKDHIPKWDQMGGRLHLFIPKKGEATASFAAGACLEASSCINGNAKWKPASKNQVAGQIEFKLFSPKSEALKLEIVRADAAQISPWMPLLVSTNPCLMEIKVSPNRQISLESECHLRAMLNLPPLKGVSRIHPPTHADFVYQLGASANLKDSLNPYSGKLRIESHPVLEPILKSLVSATSEFHGNLAGATDHFHHKTDVSLDARVPEVHVAVNLLHESEWAIPAPVNNLRGPIQVNLKSTWTDWESRAPFKLSTYLESKEQAFNTAADGVIALDIEPKLAVVINADWVLENVRLSLPQIDPKQIPRFFSDPEIQKPKSKLRVELDTRSDTSRLTYAVHIHTIDMHPARLDTNLLKDPIKIKIDSTIQSSSDPNISLEIDPLSFEVFRRKAVLDSFRYSKVGGQTEDYVNGTLHLHSGNYKVLAHLFGASDKIKVQLTSEPPVPEAELWAVLLFGEPMNHLDVDQQDSSQASARAFSQGALGIMSLYVFASTPIERVNYDPATQHVSVSFRLAEGTSVELGRSSASSAELALKRRLGKGWEFDAQVSKSDDTNTSQKKSARAGAGIEWSSRY